jgi:cell division protein FtsB
VGLGLFCIIIAVIILVAALLKSDRRLLLNRLFIGFILCNIGIVSSDVVAWLMTENTGRYAFYLIRSANFLHYAFGSLILTVMTLYMIAYIETNVKVVRELKIAVLSLCALSMILTVISQFNGMYYTIDEYNVYHRGELFILSQILPVIGMIINIGIIFFYRKALAGKAMLFFMTYYVLPTIALLIQMLFYGITFINIALTLTVLILYISVHTEREKNMAMRITFAENQLKHQSEHYNTLQTHITETKQARHDLRHHLSVIKSYIDMGETEKLTAYISEYESSLPDDTEIIFCENYAVNSILRYYIGIARREGTHVSTKIDFPENAGVSDSDLCIVFGNCIENAVEACRNIDEGKKFIKINAGLTGEMITITIDNSFNGTINETNGVFMSQKRKDEGIGISSVKAVARKYDGVVRFETTGYVFQASVMLKMKLPSYEIR